MMRRGSTGSIRLKRAKWTLSPEITLNAAGQAAICLAGSASHVHLIVRGRDIRAHMSDYLAHRLEGVSELTVHTQTEVTDRY